MEISIDFLLSGFKEAYKRTRDTKNEKDPEKLFHCLFETLNWIVAIDDRLRSDKHDDSWFDQYRINGDEGNFIRALRFARNRVHHQWADIVFNTPGGQLPMQLPAALHEWRWEKLSNLPPALPHFADYEGKLLYLLLLEDQPARMALQKVASVLEQIS